MIKYSTLKYITKSKICKSKKAVINILFAKCTILDNMTV